MLTDTQDKVSEIGLIIGAVGAFISLLLTVIFLIGMPFWSGDLITSSKYNTPVAFQQFLMDKPDYKLFLNDKELTKFSTDRINTPCVFKIVTPSGKSYEVFIDSKTPIIAEDKIMIDYDTTNSNINIALKKDDIVIDKLTKEKKEHYQNTKGYMIYWLWKLIYSGIFFLIFIPPFVDFYCNKAYPYVRDRVKELK